MTNETLVELAEIVLKNNMFKFNEKTLKKKLNGSHANGGDILMIYFLSGNMGTIY